MSMSPALSVSAVAKSRRLERRWVLREQSPGVARELEAACGIHPAVARVLAARGWSDGEGVRDYLTPKLSQVRDPLTMRDMEKAAARAAAAILAGERICVYGDYDADGLSATTLLVSTLRFLGADPKYMVPHRLDDGYGLHVGRVDELAREGVTLIITVDNGISAFAPIARARELGMDVIVTDHHLSSGELPDAFAIVNPNLADAPYGGGPLCGTGVAFKFAHALLRRVRGESPEARAFLRSLLDLVALATVADMVPLADENRVLTRHGLAMLGESARPGLRALMSIAWKNTPNVDAEVVSFGLAPRLNAASRTDGDAMLALRLLLCEDDAEARVIAAKLDGLNRERRVIETAILRSCIEDIESNGLGDSMAFVLAAEGWHVGVVGTVAARVCDRFHRPSVVLCLEEGIARGSARSIRGYDIHSGLSSCRHHLTRFGGHAAAAGLQLDRERVPHFREDLAAHARETIPAERLFPTLDIDTEIDSHEINWGMLDGLRAMEPFGEGNRAPMFLLRDVPPTTSARVVGTTHLRLRLSLGGQLFDAIGFGLAEHLEHWRGSAMHDVVVRPRENFFRGQHSLEIEMFDSRVATT